jgi:hypothetical protein
MRHIELSGCSKCCLRHIELSGCSMLSLPTFDMPAVNSPVSLLHTHCSAAHHPQLVHLPVGAAWSLVLHAIHFGFGAVGDAPQATV